MIADVDVDNTGTIDFHEFLTLMATQMKQVKDTSGFRKV